MKASVPKLFNCPGATTLFLTPSQEIGWLVIAASRDRLKNLQHRGIAPSWSRKPPQTHQDFRLKRFGLRARLSAPAQDKTITPHIPLSQEARLWRSEGLLPLAKPIARTTFQLEVTAMPTRFTEQSQRFRPNSNEEQVLQKAREHFEATLILSLIHI